MLSCDSSGLRNGFVTNTVFVSTAEYVFPSIVSSLVLKHRSTSSAAPAGVIHPYATGDSVSIGLPTSESSERSFRGAQRRIRWSIEFDLDSRYCYRIENKTV